MKQTEIEELKAELSFYRALFDKNDLMDKIQNALGCTQQLAAVIKVFYNNGEATNDVIVHAASPFGRGKEFTPSYAKIIMWRVRQIFDHYGIEIETQYNKGYKLTGAGWKKLKSKVK